MVTMQINPIWQPNIASLKASVAEGKKKEKTFLATMQ